MSSKSPRKLAWGGLMGMLALFGVAVFGALGVQRATPQGRELAVSARAQTQPAPLPDAPSPNFELHVLDVGQGDAILMRVADGRAVLVDGGESRETVLAHLRRLGVDALELVIASHNHADHIGGLIRVFEEIPVRFYMDNGVPQDTRTYEALLLAVEASGAQLLEPEPRVIRLAELTLSILPPSGRVSWGQNDNSIGVLAEVTGFRAFMGGDAESRQWRAWLEALSGGTLGFDALVPGRFEGVHVLKASHHGSRNGDTAEGLRWLKPEVVVISSAAQNRYGHPHDDALALYEEAGVRCVLRTALLGTVTFEIDPDGNWRSALHPTCS